jgi:hypothetical protein
MDQKTRSVRRPAHIPTDRFAIIIHENHITRLEKSKMSSERIRPESVWIFGIADGDVARHAFCVSFAGENAEGDGHVFERPFSVRVERDEGGDSGEAGSLGDHLEGSLFLFDGRCLGLGGFGGDGHGGDVQGGDC